MRGDADSFLEELSTHTMVRQMGRTAVREVARELMGARATERR